MRRSGPHMILCAKCKTIQKVGTVCTICKHHNLAKLAQYDWSGVEDTDGVDDKRPKSTHLANRQRIAINERLRKAGLDGNGRFTSPSVGLDSAQNVLGSHGIEVLDEPNSWALTKYDQFRLNLDVGWTNQEDSFSPVAIDNSMLFYTWYKLADDVYECLAYLS